MKIYQVIATEYCGGGIRDPRANKTIVEDPTVSFKEAQKKFDEYKSKYRSEAIKVAEPGCLDVYRDDPNEFRIDYSVYVNYYSDEVVIKEYKL